MKKKALALLISLLLVLSLAACGSSAAAPKSFDLADNGGFAAETESQSYDAASGFAPEPAPAEEPAAADTPDASEGSAPTMADKIIYSGYANIETTDFDKSLEAVDALVKRVGGFLESSSVTGVSPGSAKEYRTADYVIRIPAASFEEVTTALSDVGSVVRCSTSAENITTQYRDTKGRLDAYQIEYDRLLDMLAKAETVEDMLSIESRLSDVRYNIESLTTTITGWDSLINYSTLSLYVVEVKDYTDSQGSGGYWQEMGEGFKDTLKAVGNFFAGLFMFLIAGLPVIIILAVVAVAVILIVKRRKAKKARKDELPPQDKP